MKTSATPEVAGDPERVLRARLSLIEQSLGQDPALAEARAAELLAAFPGHPMALLFRGIARRLMGDPAAAIEVLLSRRVSFQGREGTRQWRMHEAWVFDDTNEHEAWNDTDGLRVILIFDVWKPFLPDSGARASSGRCSLRKRVSGDGHTGGSS